MGLKDIGKIVANANRMDEMKAAAEKDKPVTTTTRASRESAAKAEAADAKRFAGINTTPFTSKPADTRGHVGFKFDSRNPFHKDILNTLVNNGDDKDLVLSERGVSIPKALAEHPKYKTRFATASGTSEGGGFSFDPQPSEATKVEPRKSEGKSKPAARPAKPKAKPTAPVQKTYKTKIAPTNVKQDLTDLFAGSNTSVIDRAGEKRRAEADAKARAEADKAARAEARRRLREEGDDDLPSFGSRYS